MASAQPAARRTQQRQSPANTISTRAQISFPTTAPMEEDVVWRRDIYRELKLDDDANAGLYYPVEPVGSQMNLFTYIFKLMMNGPKRGGIAAYTYRMDGNEVFTDSARVNPLQFLITIISFMNVPTMVFVLITVTSLQQRLKAII